MASRLTLKKRNKYPPPFDDSDIEKKSDEDKKITKDMNLNNTKRIKTYADVVKPISKETGLHKRHNEYEKEEKTYDEDEIFTKAIAIAKDHNIKLKPGRKDRGYGNCVFEAVINNINDRECFKEKLKQTPNWYRRLWMNQMLDRIICKICPWNPGFTEKQLRDGFEKVKQSGVYEVDYFGDMMLGGIACGIGKRILVFNTGNNLVHDVIAVADPKHFDWRINIDDEMRHQ